MRLRATTWTRTRPRELATARRRQPYGCLGRPRLDPDPQNMPRRALPDSQHLRGALEGIEYLGRSTLHATTRQRESRSLEGRETIEGHPPVSTNQPKDHLVVGARVRHRLDGDATSPHRGRAASATTLTVDYRALPWDAGPGRRKPSAPPVDATRRSRSVPGPRRSRRTWKVRIPQRVRIRHVAPSPPQSVGDSRLKVEAPTQFFQKPIALEGVVSSASRHYVGPTVFPAATSRNDVIDGVGVF